MKLSNLLNMVLATSMLLSAPVAFATDYSQNSGDAVQLQNMAYDGIEKNWEIVKTQTTAMEEYRVLMASAKAQGNTVAIPMTIIEVLTVVPFAVVLYGSGLKAYANMINAADAKVTEKIVEQGFKATLKTGRNTLIAATIVITAGEGFIYIKKADWDAFSALYEVARVSYNKALDMVAVLSQDLGAKTTSSQISFDGVQTPPGFLGLGSSAQSRVLALPQFMPPMAAQ